MTQIAPYGSWESPISAADTVAGVVGFQQIAVDGDTLYWIETRPSEGGRQVLVRRRADGSVADVLPASINVRTMVHEYGGTAYAVEDGTIVYSDFSDHRLYRRDPDGTTQPITPEPQEPAGLRFVEPIITEDGRVVCIRESHTDTDEPVNELVAVPLDGDGVGEVLATGRDFYAAPTLSPDGGSLAWLEWDHPNMPWDGTELVVARYGTGLLDRRIVAGGPEESIAQPEWDSDGTLVFASDRTGWWNLHRYDGLVISGILEMDAEFAEPLWWLGTKSFAILSGGRILASFIENGVWNLGVVSPDGTLDRLDLGFSYQSDLVTDGRGTAFFTAYSVVRPSALVEFDVESATATAVAANEEPAPPAFFPAAELITFPTTEGDVAHGIYYPPTNPDFEAPDGELPPLIVKIHGGPTSAAVSRLRVEHLFWTSRGFGLVDVNYRGSTGFGREFRKKLEDLWGVVDVDDAVSAAAYLAATGRVDPGRAVIRGGSAGGFTVLAALAFRDLFRAGASYYGVADIGLLADDTHKFESRYLDRLTGTDRDVMSERSPLYSADRIAVPVILFQGLEDRVVPPEQAEKIAGALADRGIPHALITYEGEDHGFRKAENIVHSLESELAFYGMVLGFEPAGELPELVMS